MIPRHRALIPVYFAMIALVCAAGPRVCSAEDSSFTRSPTFFGPSGYVFLPSSEVLGRGASMTFVTTGSLTAPELDVSIQLAGFSTGITDTIEAGCTFRSAKIDSVRSLGMGAGETHYRGEEATVFAKCMINRSQRETGQYIDSAVTIGVSLPVSSMSGLSPPLRKIYESIDEELGQKVGHPTVYLAYGGYRVGGGPATSLYLKLGDSLSLGLGFRSIVFGGRLELTGEYIGTIYQVEESLLDRTQLSLGIRKQLFNGRAALKVAVSSLEINLEGTGGQDDLATTLDNLVIGLDVLF